MKKATYLIFLSLMVAGFSRCTKDRGTCFGSTGKIITQDRDVPAFHYITVYDNINMILTQDSSANSIRVEAGKNLVDGITTDVAEGRLVLQNRNSCDWLRSFEVPINVYITFTHLDTVFFHAAGNVTFTNEWTDSLIYFDVEEGSGKIELRLNTYKSFISNFYGTADVSLTGTSEVTFISSQAYGPLHAEELNSKFTYVYSDSPNDIFVNALVDMSADIRNRGNIYYRGNPRIVALSITGEGKLIEF